MALQWVLPSTSSCGNTQRAGPWRRQGPSVSHYYRKLPQVYWLKTTQVYSLIDLAVRGVVGVRSLKWVTVG